MLHTITLLLFASILFLSVEQSVAGPTQKPAIINGRNFCRNHIFSPRCRGQQKRDVMSYSTEEYRVPALDDVPNRELAAILNSPTLLGELLRKLIESSSEYEAETPNYLK